LFLVFNLLHKDKVGWRDKKDGAGLFFKFFFAARSVAASAAAGGNAVNILSIEHQILGLLQPQLRERCRLFHVSRPYY
jgi:hypothetical protein